MRPSPACLSRQDEQQGFTLLCRARPLSDIVVEVKELSLASIAPKTVPCRVVGIERPSPDVAIVSLKLPPQENMLYAAGQYIDFLLEDGKRRSYSIANVCPAGGAIELQLHVRHIPGGLFTDRLFSGEIAVRQVLRFEGPLGTFQLREDSDKPIVLLASGTGIAPIKALCEYIFRQGINRTRRVALYWGCRTTTDLYVDGLARSWEREHVNFSYVPVLSEVAPGEAWDGRKGLVHSAVLEDYNDLSGHQVYACGVPVMVDAARRDFSAQRGLPLAEFFADSFLTAAEVLGGSSDRVVDDGPSGRSVDTKQRVITDEIGGWVKPRNEKSIARPFIMSHGTVASRNLKATRRFYEEFLGLECVRHSKASMVFRCGLRFHVACVELGEHCPDSGLHNHWGLDLLTKADVDRVHREALRLREVYGIRDIQEPQLQRGVYSFYLTDLDGNWWEIQHYDGFRHDDHFEFGDRFSMDEK